MTRPSDHNSGTGSDQDRAAHLVRLRENVAKVTPVGLEETGP